MATIGNLKVDLGLNSAAFDVGLKNAGKGMDGLAKQAAVMGAAIAAAVTAAAGAFTAIVMKTSEAANATGDMADMLGLNVESLQELRHAADRGGMGMQNFDVAMRRFIRRSAEAANGTGAAKGAFKELGIELRTTDGRLKDSEALLAEVADAMEGVQSPADKLRLAFQMFDTDGAKMVNVLAGGSEELERLREEARKLGIVLSERTVRAAQMFHDNLDTLRKMMEGLQNNLTSAVLPAFVYLTDRFIDAAQAGGGFQVVIDVVSGAFNGLVRAVAWALDNISTLINLTKIWAGLKIASVVIGVSRAFFAYARTLQAAGAAKAILATLSRINIVTLGVLGGVVLAVTGHLDGFIEKVEEAAGKILALVPDEWKTGIQDATNDLNNLWNSFDIIERAIDGASGSLGEFNALAGSGKENAFQGAVNAAKEATTGLHQQAAAFGLTATAADRFNKSMELVRAAEKAKMAITPKLLAQIDGLAVAYAQAAENVRWLAEAQQMAEQMTGRLANGLTDLFESAITGGKDFLDIIGNILRDLGRMLLNQAFMGLLGGGMGGGLFSGIGKLFGFARGGTIMPGGAGGIDSQLVMFRKSPNERVDITKPGQTLTSGDSGPSELNFNITVSGARSNSEIRQMVEEGMDSALQTVRQHLPDWVANPRVKFV